MIFKLVYNEDIVSISFPPSDGGDYVISNFFHMNFLKISMHIVVKYYGEYTTTHA